MPDDLEREASDPTTRPERLVTLAHPAFLAEPRPELVAAVLRNPSLTVSAAGEVLRAHVIARRSDGSWTLPRPLVDALLTNAAVALWALDDPVWAGRWPREVIEALCLSPAAVLAWGSPLLAAVRALPVPPRQFLVALRTTAQQAGGASLVPALFGPLDEPR